MRSSIHLAVIKLSAAILLSALAPSSTSAQTLPSDTKTTSRLAPTFEPLRGHSEMIHTLAYAPDGRTLISAGADHTLRFWRLHQDRIDPTERSRREQLLVDVNHPRFSIRQTAFKELAELGLAIKPLLQQQLQSQLSPEAKLRMGRLIAMADIPQGVGHRREVRDVAVSPNGEVAVSAGRDNVIGFWDVSIGRPIGAINGHADGAWCVQFSIDGLQLASGGGDHRVRIWNVETKLQIGELLGHESTVHDLQYSRDAALLASAGGFDQSVRIWDLKSSRCMHVLGDHQDAVMCLAFSPDGKTVASGGYDGRIYLWDVESGKLTRSFAAHDGIIRDMAFSPLSNSQLISVADDRLAHRWDCETGRKTETYQRHHSAIRAIAFAPDGKSFATAGRYGVIHRWPAGPASDSAVSDN